MSLVEILSRSVAAAALLAAAPAVLAQEGDTEDPDARIDYDPEVMGQQTGPDGEVPESSLAAAIREAIDDGGLERRLRGAPDAIRNAAEQTYVMRVFDPVWSSGGAADFLAALEESGAYGMEIAPAMISEVETAVRTLEGRPSRSEAAQADLTLSAAFMQYADARINGAVDPADLDGVKFETPNPEPLRRRLGQAGAGELDHSRLDPDHSGYRDLTSLLEVYRDHADAGGFTEIDTNAVVEPGEEADIVPALRRRLAEEGYEAEDSEDQDEGSLFSDLGDSGPFGDEADADREREDERDSDTVYAKSLQGALEAFQSDHGLKVDGVLGPRTIAMLNMPVEDKIARIEANMERWRWAPASMPDRHVRVNPPAYVAQGYEDGEPTITMDAIVGQGARQTPMMADAIEFLVANPEWYVPESILEKDKLEEIREDADHIPNNDYFVLDRETGDEVPHREVDWNDPEVEKEYRLVQGAGEENALGQIKFMFPNEHAIYLHGTPADELFDERERAFSSGCVRLERPLDMARWIVSENGGDLSYSEVEAAVDSEDTTRLPLAEPLPVFLFYFTVEEGEDGEGVFHDDIYGRDDRLIEALDASPIALSASGGA